MLNTIATGDKLVKVADFTFKMQPFTIGVKYAIANHFESKGKDGLDYFVSVLSNQSGSTELIDVLIDSFYLFIKEPEITLDDFKKEILKLNTAEFEKISSYIANAIKEADPLYDFDEGISKKKMKILGATSLILSTIGLVYLISLLIDTAIKYQIF